MAEMKTMTKTNISYGDTAVDGLLGGALSGGLMAIYLIITGLIGGDGVGVTMARFAPSGNSSALVGTVGHLEVSAIYGVIFALALAIIGRVWPNSGKLSWLLGAIFGLTLWLAAEFIILPAVDTPLQMIEPVHFALAHLVYGLALGLIVGRTNR
jgi:uncharacterized membrane protein YagU involved in acid resistance